MLNATGCFVAVTFSERNICRIDPGTVCTQKERYIQVSKVDDDERKRREQQKLEKEQVSLG